MVYRIHSGGMNLPWPPLKQRYPDEYGWYDITSRRHAAWTISSTDELNIDHFVIQIIHWTWSFRVKYQLEVCHCMAENDIYVIWMTHCIGHKSSGWDTTKSEVTRITQRNLTYAPRLLSSIWYVIGMSYDQFSGTYTTTCTDPDEKADIQIFTTRVSPSSPPHRPITNMYPPCATSLTVRFMGPTRGPSGADSNHYAIRLFLVFLISYFAADVSLHNI